MELEYRNVNDAFEGLVSGIADGTIPTVKSPSRVGDVLQIPQPVTVTYHRPEERVLFNVYRDANVFFHLYESLWMLAGRNDIAPLVYYSANYADFVQDGDNSDANGAYGYRWRHAKRPDWVHGSIGTDDHCPHCGMGEENVDQLDILIDHFKSQPNSRRAVLQMWNVVDDLLNIGDPVEYSKDVCCNVCAFFSIRNLQTAMVDTRLSPEQIEAVRRELPPAYLDMTVVNRSNDIVLGMLGANVVHFSFLQEYIANALGVEVGVYNQFSNNAHVYTERFKPNEWLRAPITMFDHPNDDQLIYNRSDRKKVPLVKDRVLFDEEVARFVSQHEYFDPQNGQDTWSEPFLMNVAKPMCHAFHFHKQRDYTSAMYWLNQVQADDWRIAGINWILKRQENYNRKTTGSVS